ncbi:MAG: DUF805 domain-containing protein [Candidatus Cloacimonetes bacterium]|nr:DUF805 domain-containing protein [Candidatus Cloacimonadota bacterium]
MDFQKFLAEFDLELILSNYFGTWRKFRDFQSRAGRREYFTFLIINFIIHYLLKYLGNYTEIAMIYGVTKFDLLFEVFILLLSLAVTVRRLHDTGNSGWFIIVPLYNFLLMFREGDKGKNEFGEVPEN